MQDHLARIMGALERYSLMNHQPAVDEPANEFEQAVNAHAELQALMEEIKSLLKPLEAAERRLRDGIADSLKAFYGVDLREGVNNYELSNGRTVKFTFTVDRKVDESHIVAAREAFGTPTSGAMFDDLLRVKYELNKTVWKKLSEEQRHKVSRMIVAKDASPTVKVD